MPLFFLVILKRLSLCLGREGGGNAEIIGEKEFLQHFHLLPLILSENQTKPRCNSLYFLCHFCSWTVNYLKYSEK